VDTVTHADPPNPYFLRFPESKHKKEDLNSLA